MNLLLCLISFSFCLNAKTQKREIILSAGLQLWLFCVVNDEFDLFSSFAITHRLKANVELKVPPSFLFPEADFNIQVVKLFPESVSHLQESSWEPLSHIQVDWGLGILKGRQNKWRHDLLLLCTAASPPLCETEAGSYWKCHLTEAASVHPQNHAPPERKFGKLFCSSYRFRAQDSAQSKAPEGGSDLKTYHTWFRR